MHGDPGFWVSLETGSLCFSFHLFVGRKEGGREKGVQADGFRGSWSVLGWLVAWFGGYGKVGARNQTVDRGDSDVGNKVLLD
jgi:hypothetical protein